MRRWPLISMLLVAGGTAKAGGLRTTYSFGTTVGPADDAHRYKPEWEGEIPVPKGLPWACRKSKVMLLGGVSTQLDEGSAAIYTGAFSCVSGKGYASAVAMCEANKASTDIARFCIGETATPTAQPFCLFVSCETR